MSDLEDFCSKVALDGMLGYSRKMVVSYPKLADHVQGWGWACEQIVAIDVVTAEGHLLHADKDQNSELYWAARGCGPGFPGIITRFHLQTRPASKVMRSSAYIYPVSEYKKAFDWVLQVRIFLK
jgi:FAD/FMN-containing dehydrogenase